MAAAEGSSSRRKHVEELVDWVERLWNETFRSLYPFGQAPFCLDYFRSLGSSDRTRLLYLAVRDGDPDRRRMAEYLAAKIRLPFPDKQALLDAMRPEDRAEMEALERSDAKVPVRAPEDEMRIMGVLRQAAARIGWEPVEHGFWILLPWEPDREPQWRPLQGDHSAQRRIRFPDHVPVDLTCEEEWNVIFQMRKAKWVLDVHNHPDPDGTVGEPSPSEEDVGSAISWRRKRAGLVQKYLSFVLCRDRVVEYGCPGGGMREFVIPGAVADVAAVEPPRPDRADRTRGG